MLQARIRSHQPVPTNRVFRSLAATENARRRLAAKESLQKLDTHLIDCENTLMQESSESYTFIQHILYYVTTVLQMIKA